MWSDYGARWYPETLKLSGQVMPELGRFSGVDPISDQFPHVSVYNYAENEPISSIDLWGLQKVNVMRADKNGIVAPTHTMGSTIYQGRNVTRPPQFNGPQATIGPAGQGTLDPVASTVGRQLVQSAPMVMEDLGGAAVGIAKGAYDAYNGDNVGASLEAIGVILPGMTGKALKNARQSAVRNAWQQEHALVESGAEGTRNWTKAELGESKETGKVKGYQGHHINNVKDHPNQAGDPNNVEFVKKGNDHLQKHGGNYRNKTTEN